MHIGNTDIGGELSGNIRLTRNSHALSMLSPCFIYGVSMLGSSFTCGTNPEELGACLLVIAPTRADSTMGNQPQEFKPSVLSPTPSPDQVDIEQVQELQRKQG
ncbi:MAG: hypothetical protein RIC35_19370 [Marinoscillum sp.]